MMAYAKSKHAHSDHPILDWCFPYGCKCRLIHHFFNNLNACTMYVTVSVAERSGLRLT